MDPFPGVATLPDTLNPYLYTLNNPVNWTDPSGRFFFIPLLVAGLIGGFLGGVGYYSLSSLLNKTCWNPGEAMVWGGGGAILGALLATFIYGGWWAGSQMGWWGAAGTIGTTVAAGNEANALPDFSNLPGATASQIKAMIPEGWTETFSPFIDRFGNFIDQIKYTSPDGLQELRIHSPMTGYASWVARWGVQVPEAFYNVLPNASDWISKWEGTYWANLNRLGMWVPVVSDSAHIAVSVNNLLDFFIK